MSHRLCSGSSVHVLSVSSLLLCLHCTMGLARCHTAAVTQHRLQSQRRTAKIHLHHQILLIRLFVNWLLTPPCKSRFLRLLPARTKAQNIEVFENLKNRDIVLTYYVCFKFALCKLTGGDSYFTEISHKKTVSISFLKHPVIKRNLG